MDPKGSISSSKSSSFPSYRGAGENLVEEVEEPIDLIVVESGPLSSLPDLQIHPPKGQDAAILTPTDESISCNPSIDDGDDEDEEESESLDANVIIAGGYGRNSTRELNSLAVNNATTQTEELEGSVTRNGKLRRLVPHRPLKHRKAPTGRCRMPHAPSPIIPPRGMSPWPEIQESDSNCQRASKAARQSIVGTNEPVSLSPGESQLFFRDKEDAAVLSAEERLKRSKRAKISPRKEKQPPNRQHSPPVPLLSSLAREEAISGTATLQSIFNTKAPEKEDSDPTLYNEEVCSACGGPGRFLCCEGCPKSFHFSCLNPPVNENDLPKDSWYCNFCRTLRDPPNPSDNRLFHKLVDQANRMNPMAFRLPRDIRNYFDGVTTGEDGEYQEPHEVKPVRANAQGVIREPDPFCFCDKNGDPIFCYRCGDTASQARRMLSCDHCSQHWHMDCLDPPLPVLPPLTKKWMCPLHALHAYRKMRRPKHKFGVVEVGLISGFKTSGGDIETENYDSTEGHKLLEDRFESDFSIDGTTYRLPEKGIKLDFLEKIHMERLRPRSLNLLSEQAAPYMMATHNIRPQMEDVLRPTQGLRWSERRDYLHTLLQAALAESLSPTNPESLRENHSRQVDSSSNTLCKKEAKQLRAVKQLMELKGYEAMMRFLET